MRLEAGALVTDKVRLLHLLREGGIGTVWVGEHLTFESRVAVKFVSAELARKSDSAVERFKREARAAAKLNLRRHRPRGCCMASRGCEPSSARSCRRGFNRTRRGCRR